MSRSLYNPFMPSVHFRDRAVFGGGDSNGTTPLGFNEGGITESDQRKKDAAAITQYIIDLDMSIAGAGNAQGLDTIAKTGLKIQAAKSTPRPGVTYGAEEISSALNTKLSELNKTMQDAQSVGAADLASETRKLVSQTITDPGSLAKSPDVATVDTNLAGTTIADGTGSVKTDFSDIRPFGGKSKFKIPVVDEGKVDPSTLGSTNVAAGADPVTASTMTATTAADAVKAATEGATAATGTVSAEGVVQAATKDPTTTDVSTITAAQGTATVMNNPVQREIQEGELVSGVADATKAAAFSEQIQAATATASDKATVKGQLDDLMQDFEGGATPTWAAGAMRNANAQMAARGLGASSMAGQAIIQAAMESALPIAMQDAQTVAGFEMQNLSNRQQRAMLAAQQRATFIGQEFDQAFQARVANSAKISDIANMNFTAEQSVALENSRNANTMNLNNLSNSQAMLMAQASSIANLEQQNLSNQQQAAVTNAKAFLDMDMANLNNNQQMEMFKSQQIIQSLFTDQAADNAAKQFNASSETQTKQFMANLQLQTQQFNATQLNTTQQFNSGVTNAARQFNAQVENQRQEFNAKNALVIAQANAQWRQNVATYNSQAQNQANMQQAQAANAFTQGTIDQIWQRERDLMDYAYKGAEASKTRALDILLADKKYEEYQKVRDTQEESDKWAVFTKFGLDLIGGI
jgi:hypothetical protein